MKIKQGFVLQNVVNTHIVVPVSQDTLNYKGMLSLNETGAFLWSALEKGTDREGLLKALLEEYDVQEAVAAADMDEFLDHIERIGALER